MENIASNVRWDEREEIDLLQLLAAVLKHIRAILICTLIFALLLGGWKTATGMRAARSTVVTEAEIEEQSEDAIAAEKQFARVSAMVEEYETYRNNSILLNLDPWSFYERNVVWHIEPNDAEIGEVYRTHAAGLTSAYSALLTSNDFYEYAHEYAASSADVRYIRELFSLRTDAGAATLYLTVVADSEELATELCNAAESYLEQLKPQFDASVCAHEIALIGDWAYGADESGPDNNALGGANVTGAQRRIIDAQNNFDKELAALQSTLPQLKEQAAAAQTGGGAAVDMTAVLKDGAKYAIIGALLGAVLMCIWIVLRIVVRDVALDEAQLCGQSGLPVLASVRKFPDNTKWHRMLSKLSGDGKRAPTLEDAAALAQVNAASMLGSARHAGEKVLLVGRDQAIPELARLMDSADMPVAFSQGDITSDKDAVEALSGYENIVLVERKECVSHQEITRELEKLLLLKKNVVGLIAL